MRFASMVIGALLAITASGCGALLDFDPPDPQRDAAAGSDGGADGGVDAGSDAGMPDAGRCRMDSQCDDGVYCNGAETCSGGTCVPGTAITCPTPSLSCVTSACDETTRHCVPHANDALCASTEYCDPAEGCRPRPTCAGDGDCTTADHCAVGSCVMGTCHFAPVVCTDTVTSDCLVPICEPDTGCVPTRVDALCEDGILCTSSTCQDTGDCTLQRLDDSLCDFDGAACTVDTCEPSSPCADPLTGCAQRVDGTYCATFAAGVTLPGIPPGCGIGVCSPPSALDASSGCAVTPYCTRPGATCSADTGTPVCTDLIGLACTVSSTCDDGNPCNGVETCDAMHHCAPGTPPCSPFGGASICTVDESSGAAVCTSPIPACTSGGGTLGPGAECPGPSGESCGAGLSCCYPCGVPGCTNQCVPTCTGGACVGGCPLVP